MVTTSLNFFWGFIEFRCIFFEPGLVHARMSFEQIAMPNASLRRVSVSDADAQNRVLCEKLSFFAKVVNEKQVISGTIWQKQKGNERCFKMPFKICIAFFEINRLFSCCVSFFNVFLLTSISFILFRVIQSSSHPAFQVQGSVCIVRRF